VTASLTRAYFNLGVLQAQGRGPESPAERYARAAALFEEAARLDPEFPQVQSSLGVAHFNARQFEKSVAPLTLALAAHPQDASLKRMLAAAYVNTHAWNEAARLLQEDPDRASDQSLEFAYGLALLRAGRPAEAEPVFGGLVERHGDTAELRLLLGQAQLAQDKYGPALVSLERAVQLNPAAEDAHAALAGVLMKQDRAAEGLEHLETAVRLAPANPQLHELLGQAYQGLGRATEAEQQFATARRLLEKGPERRP
jgi:predicted Zn-dependent protease